LGKTNTGLKKNKTEKHDNKGLPVKEKKINLLEILVKHEGTYTGFGKDQDEKEFKGSLEMSNVAGNKGVLIRYRAIGVEGNEFNKSTTLFNRDTVLFNEETTIICYDNQNKLSLWTLNNKIGTMTKFDFRRYRQVSSKHSLFIFGFGAQEDNNVFREEITIELWENQDISYNYSWGEAGGHFLSRSVIRMKKIS
jgi:hypothetical protein